MIETKRNIFRYVDGEESQNDFFASLLSWAETPRVLNAIHTDDSISFDDSAEVVATQRDGLPEFAPENDHRRTLDWVVRDQTKLVGYESKCGDGLSDSQLREERRKLEHNAHRRDIHLFAVTEDVCEPEFTADATWKRWEDIGQAVIEMGDKSEAVEIMADMFRDKGYEGFRGFTEYRRDEHWLVTHQNETVDLVLEATDCAEDLRLYDKGEKHLDHHNRVKKNIYDVKEKDHRSLGPPYHIFSVHPLGYRDTETNYNISGNSWYIAIIVPALHNEVYVQMNTYPSKDTDVKELLRDNADALTDIVTANDMHVETSWNSLSKEESPTRYTDPEDIRHVLSKKSGYKTAKRIRFGWEVDTDQSPDAIIEETADKMERLHTIFYDGIQRREEFGEVPKQRSVVEVPVEPSR